jgi:hypothetical protein
MRKRFAVNVTVMVPDHARLIIGARRLPTDWRGPISQEGLAVFADHYGWEYLAAGTQERHRFRPGGTIMYEATLDAWRNERHTAA